MDSLDLFSNRSADRSRALMARISGGRHGGFHIDREPVSNADFAAFVAATGHRTLAEQPPTPTTAGIRWWTNPPGADWRHPGGPGTDLTGRERLPVVHVGWLDVIAFATWAGKRPPTEFEWLRAAHSGVVNGSGLWEWTADWYSPLLTPAEAGVSQTASIDFGQPPFARFPRKVIRGGPAGRLPAPSEVPGYVRAAQPIDLAAVSLGFRCAMYV